MSGVGATSHVTGPSHEPKTAFLAVCYDECRSRPVRVHPAGCGCEDSACEYSRVCDSFCVVMLPDLPRYHKKADEADAEWMKKMQEWAAAGSKGPRPVAPCPEIPDDPCVVLAQVTLPVPKEPIETAAIDNTVHRVLNSTHVLQGLIG